MTAREGGEAKAIQRADGAATEGNRETAPPLSSGAVTSLAYAEPAGGRQAPLSPPDSRRSGGPPPPALKVGQTIAVHTASCESPEQHRRVTVGGVIAEVYPDGAARALMDDGSSFELCPWFTSDCANAPYAFTEERAA